MMNHLCQKCLDVWSSVNDLTGVYISRIVKTGAESATYLADDECESRSSCGGRCAVNRRE
jgi:hypothetical protein